MQFKISNAQSLWLSLIFINNKCIKLKAQLFVIWISEFLKENKIRIKQLKNCVHDDINDEKKKTLQFIVRKSD